MAEQDFKGFTKNQREAALSLLEQEISLNTLYAGLEMLSKEPVIAINWSVPGMILDAAVVEGRPYTQRIVFGTNGILEASCSCKKRTRCKHLAIVVISATEDWPTVDAPSPAAKSPPATQPRRQSTAKPQFRLSTVQSAARPAPSSMLTEFLVAQCGKPLSRREESLVEAIERQWAAGGNSIPETRFVELGGHTGYFHAWRSEPVIVWPAHRRPATTIDAFRYIAHALRQRDQLPANLPMYSTIDWKAVDELIAPWVREIEIEEWRRELRKLSLIQRERPAPLEFRLRMDAEGGQIEWRPSGSSEFVPVKANVLRECGHAAARSILHGKYPLDASAHRFLIAVQAEFRSQPVIAWSPEACKQILNVLLRQPGFENSVVSPAGVPLVREPRPLKWAIEEPASGTETGTETGTDDGRYHLVLRTAEGEEVGPSLATLKGEPTLYVMLDRVYELNDPLNMTSGSRPRIAIPSAAVESEEGIAALRVLDVPLPEPLAARVEILPFQVSVRCCLGAPPGESAEYFQTHVRASADGRLPEEIWNGVNWELAATAASRPPPPSPRQTIISPDRSRQQVAARWLREAGLDVSIRAQDGTRWLGRRLQGAALREFPEVFLDWLDRRPNGIAIELDPLLASLRDGKVAGSLKLDVAEAGVDWFDLRVCLELSDVELTQEEIDLLLKAQGRWVRLSDKGWRRLDVQISDEEQAHLADLGLAAGDLKGGEKHRMHVFQLAGASAERLLPPDRVADVRRRAEELRTSVTPDVPAAIAATLRPYQRDGFHFLAYLSANRFGGILADDMGLGKTVQTLAWLAWLRESGQINGPALVVCPKSVQENWRGEVGRFCPSLKVRIWSRESAGQFVDEPAGAAKGRKKETAPPPPDDIVVINYAQLRLHERALLERHWGAIILDEAQYIKNPSSLTAKAACSLQAGHRLALSGTPIENRLLDLWSIMQFAMPGVLGNRTSFSRHFNGKDDPLARRRLAARVRPFVLRRTKKEVAKDLPDRIEEEIICELEGPQETLYRAELKHARATLLKAKTSAQLDKLRFNILTSLLRLRQICCHPSLVGAGKPSDDAAKLSALLDMLEPLVEEGHKVLVFSQFVDMLELIRKRLETREWPHLVLTGQTEDRGPLVDAFQQSEGACIFLISLKAGGFGLNLTAASYVVLYDPWWNPAVENQAIDRTHRIGQKQTVMAYRFIVRESIEEKIRELQKQKGELATDILGEESFAKALTIDDFRYLLGDEP